MCPADDNQLWQLTTPMPNGVLQTYRAQKVGDAIRFDEEDEISQVSVPGETNPVKMHTYEKTGRKIQNGVLRIVTQLLLDDARARIVLNDETKLRAIQPRFARTGLSKDIWDSVISFLIPINHDTNASLRFIGCYTLASHEEKLTLFFPKAPNLFPVLQFHPQVLIEAVLHGDEIMVRNILKTNPDLTRTAIAMDFSGRTFTGTAIQAAIAAADFAPNKNSTGLCELLFESLQKQYPENWHAIFKTQTLELYQRSLRVYIQKTENTIRILTKAEDRGEIIDEEILKKETQNHKTYLEVLHSNDLQKMIEIHTAAQTTHELQVDQTLIDTIATASDDDIQAILNNPEINSPLSNLLKTFRENFTALSHQEIIHNPQHLLKIFTLYDQFYNRVVATDPNCKKRQLFWCHLVGFVQRYLPASTAQIFANPGLFDTVEKNIKNARSFDFKFGGNRIFPLSFDANSGLGFKFDPGDVGVGGLAGGGWLLWRASLICLGACLVAYVRQKQQSWKTYALNECKEKSLVCDSVMK